MTEVDPVFDRMPLPKPPALQVRPLRLPPEELQALSALAETTGRSFNDLSREAFSFGVSNLAKFPLPELGMQVQFHLGTWNISPDGNLVESEHRTWMISGFSEVHLNLTNCGTGHGVFLPRPRTQLTRVNSEIINVMASLGIILVGDNMLYVRPMAHGLGALEIEGRKRICVGTGQGRVSSSDLRGLLLFLMRNAPAIRFEIADIRLTKGRILGWGGLVNSELFFLDGIPVELDLIQNIDIIRE